MTGQVIMLTHADVIIDPAVPVPEWPLNAVGRDRHERFAKDPLLARVSALYCSTETKARDAADIMAPALGVTPQLVAALGENDRSATGFLPKDTFEATADAFFAQPETSVRGWETARDAQARIVGAVRHLLSSDRHEGDILIISHGAVAALLRCALLNIPITRAEDQPGGTGGNWYAFPATFDAPPTSWRAI